MKRDKLFLELILLLVFSFNLSVILDIPVIRQSSAILCLLFIPGFLLSYFFMEEEKITLNKIILSILLGIPFSYLLGVVATSLYNVYNINFQPIFLLLAIYDLFFISLVLLLWRKIVYTKINDNFKLKHLIYLFPFPALILFARNIGGVIEYEIIIFTYLLIIFYVFILMFSRKKKLHNLYPFLLYSIGLSILLSRSLISNYLIGGDIYHEFHSAKIFIDNFALFTEKSLLDSCLSVSILPSIYQMFSDFSLIIIFKYLMILIISIIPVISYRILNNYFSKKYSFILSFLFIAQIPFINMLSGQLRVGISLILFYFIIYLVIEGECKIKRKNALIIILMISLILSYYVLPIFLIIFLTILYLYEKIRKKQLSISILQSTLLPAILIFLWWGDINEIGFNNYVQLFQSIIQNLFNKFISEAYSPIVTQTFNFSTEIPFAMHLPYMIQRLNAAIIIIGLIYICVNKKYCSKFPKYIILSTVGVFFLIINMIIPTLSIKYGTDRLFLQIFLFLIPPSFYGIFFGQRLINTLLNKIKINKKISLKFCLTIFMISLFFCSSSLYQQFIVGEEYHSIILDDSSFGHQKNYVFDSEVLSSSWLNKNRNNNGEIYIGNVYGANSYEIFEYLNNFSTKNNKLNYFGRTFKNESYIFLVHLNTQHRLVVNYYPYGKTIDIKVYKSFFTKSNYIYNNEKSQILLN